MLPTTIARSAAVLATVGLLLSGCAATDGSTETEDVKSVSVAIIVNNGPVDENLAGFKERMVELGYVEGETIQYNERNAQGQTANADLVARQSVDDNPDAIYVVGTPIVIGIQKLTDTVPVVFSLMTDPVGAGVADSFESPGTNFTGTSDALSESIYFDQIETLLPNAKTIGVLANTGEQNSASQVQKFEAEAAARGFELVVVPTQTTNDVQLALRSLAGRVDVVMVGADGTVLAAADTLIATATNLELPLVVSGSDYAADGAFVGIGPDFRALGRASADVLDRVLKGENPAEISIVDAVSGGGLGVSINRATAETLGIELPSGLGDNVTIIG